MIGEEGPAHDKRFKVAVELDGDIIGEGKGRSKKAAEQAAAQSALDAQRANQADDKH